MPYFEKFIEARYPYIDQRRLKRVNQLMDEHLALTQRIDQSKMNARDLAKKKESACIWGTTVVALITGYSHYMVRDFTGLSGLFFCALIASTLVAQLIGLEKKFYNKEINRKHTSDLMAKTKEIETKILELTTLLQRELKQHRDYWLSMSGWEFEVEVANLFSNVEYSTRVTKGSKDGGIDIVMERDGKVAIVQCKLHKKPVGPHVVRDLYGALRNMEADEAILVSSMGFTSGVWDFVAGKPIRLLSLEDLLALAKGSQTRRQSGFTA